MKTVNASKEQIESFLSKEHDHKAIVMLNLIKFRAEAAYPKDYDGPQQSSGSEAYGIYSKLAMPFVFGVGGQLLWRGKARAVVIAPPTETWDQVFLVYYPSRTAIKKMLSNPTYQAIAVHRQAALADSRLIECTPQHIPKLLLTGMRAFFRVRAWLFQY